MVAFVFDVICVICSLIWTSLFCYYGNYASDRVSSIAVTTYDVDWFNYPVKLQKFIILTILRSQIPVYFNGLNLIDCTIEVFGTVSIYFLIHASFQLLRISSNFKL